MDYIKLIVDKLTNNLDEFYLGTNGADTLIHTSGVSISKQTIGWSRDNKIFVSFYIGQYYFRDIAGDFEKIFDSAYSILEARQKEALLKNAVDRLYRNTRPWYKRIFPRNME